MWNSGLALRVRDAVVLGVPPLEAVTAADTDAVGM